LIKLQSINPDNLSLWVKQAQTQGEQGSVIQRIPLLAVANPNWFVVHICCQLRVSHALITT
jgi:glutaminase